MAIISKMTIRYLRRAGFPSYSHVEMEVEEEVLLEEGDDAQALRKELFLNMAEDMAERIEPIAAGYRKVTTELGGAKVAGTPSAPSAGPGKDPERTSELLREASAAAATQGELPEPVSIPEEREPQREMPEYTDEGKRIRKMGQKNFKVGEINVAWQALVDANIVETIPDHTKAANKARQDIRVWLKMTPLDPTFSQPELALVVEAYAKWRGQGLTTDEAMLEVGNDYRSTYGGVPGDSGEGAEEAEDGAEQDDQGPGGGGSSDDKGDSDSGADPEDPEDEPEPEAED